MASSFAASLFARRTPVSRNIRGSRNSTNRALAAPRFVAKCASITPGARRSADATGSPAESKVRGGTGAPSAKRPAPGRGGAGGAVRPSATARAATAASAAAAGAGGALDGSTATPSRRTCDATRANGKSVPSCRRRAFCRSSANSRAFPTPIAAPTIHSSTVLARIRVAASPLLSADFSLKKSTEPRVSTRVTTCEHRVALAAPPKKALREDRRHSASSSTVRGVTRAGLGLASEPTRASETSSEAFSRKTSTSTSSFSSVSSSNRAETTTRSTELEKSRVACTRAANAASASRAASR